MSEHRLIELARAYVAASNDHDVERIAGMLAADAAYASTGVGRHDGAEAILAMNRSFFADNPDVHWEAVNYRQVKGDGVEFDFTITLNGASSSGVERVFFGPDGRISRVEVER